MDEKSKKIDIDDKLSEEGKAETGKKTPSKSKKTVKKKTEELMQRVEHLEKEKNDLKEASLRAYAETENFKKRLTREKDDFVKYANEKVVRELLPVIDNLERAVGHAKEAGESGAFLDGVERTLELFEKVLTSLGVSHVLAVGEPFNPERHEAVQQIESADHGPNIIVSEFQKGYMLQERLIRPSMVVVAKASAEKEDEKT